MKKIIAFCFLMMAGAEAMAQLARPSFSERVLTNGIRLVCVRFPGSTNESIYSFFPMGLAKDEAGQAQWAHLVEHLVIRSTMGDDLTQANAETLADHMRLDFYGTTANWREGLSHHRRWIEGAPWTEESLRAEKPKVNEECDYTAKNFATHKFAAAAWNQAWRHGRTNAAVKGDVERATLAEARRLRDAHLVVSNRVTICVVGGVDPATAFGELEKEFGGVKLPGTAAPALKLKHGAGEFDVKWDLDARHLSITWPIPDFKDPDYAALMVTAQALSMRLNMDPGLKRMFGMTLAGVDWVTPEGTYFYLSASLRPGVSFEKAQATLTAKVKELATDRELPGMAPQFGKQIAFSMTEVPDLAMLKAQTPAGMSAAMVEGNVGLQLGLNAHRLGSDRAILAKRFENVSAESFASAARKYLGVEKASIFRIDGIDRH